MNEAEIPMIGRRRWKANTRKGLKRYSQRTFDISDELSEEEEEAESEGMAGNPHIYNDVEMEWSQIFFIFE